VYAVVQTGGRQFRVQPEEKVRIPKVETPVGETLELDRVLLIEDGGSVRVGTPIVQGAKVVAEVLSQGRDTKIIVFHKKRRKRYQKKNGHHQPFTEIRIQSIVA
jgi:large subunit ribosomal protein L21